MSLRHFSTKEAIVSESTGDLIPLAQLAKFLPPPLKNIHASTAARWALRGVGKPRVKIETLKIVGRLLESGVVVTDQGYA